MNIVNNLITLNIFFCLLLPRPIAGNVNFCLKELNNNSYDYMLKVAKHETIHALVSHPQHTLGSLIFQWDLEKE